MRSTIRQDHPLDRYGALLGALEHGGVQLRRRPLRRSDRRPDLAVRTRRFLKNALPARASPEADVVASDGFESAAVALLDAQLDGLALAGEGDGYRGLADAEASARGEERDHTENDDERQDAHEPPHYSLISRGRNDDRPGCSWAASAGGDHATFADLGA